MDLSNLSPAPGSKHNDNFRRGRGESSGNGKTARSGAPRIGFEGGQMPLFRRLPKRGFKNRNAKDYAFVNVGRLDTFEEGTVITPELLLETGVIAKLRDGVKILGEGELTKKLTVKTNKISASAKEKIEAAGGTVEVI